MKAKQFAALVRIYRFELPSIDQGSIDVEHEGTMIVHRARAVAPVHQNCAVKHLHSFEFFWIRYRGKRYPVERTDAGEGVAFDVMLLGDDNPPTAREKNASEKTIARAREERLARKLLKLGLVKIKKTRSEGGR